jgi:hypothetical protein
MINLFNWVTTLVESFTFYGGGKGGGSSQSSSQPVDFFGKDKRAPYEDALQTMLLGGGPSLDYIKSQPGFMLGSQMGQEGLQRRFASTGVGPTGYENLAINNFQNQYTGDYMQRMITNLISASGAGMVANSSTSSSTGASPIPGMIGTLGAALISSDRNLKTNIKHIDTIKGIKIYSFNYVWSYIKSVGVMAQDLLKIPEYKDAVHMTNIGYMVDYSKLPI